jgi:hypothetical protein
VQFEIPGGRIKTDSCASSFSRKESWAFQYENYNECRGGAQVYRPTAKDLPLRTGFDEITSTLSIIASPQFGADRFHDILYKYLHDSICTVTLFKKTSEDRFCSILTQDIG